MPWLKLGILAVISSGINRDLLSGQTQGDGSGTERGLDLVKVSFGIFDSCLSFPLPAIIPHPIQLTVKARKGNILGTLSPL